MSAVLKIKLNTDIVKGIMYTKVPKDGRLPPYPSLFCVFISSVHFLRYDTIGNKMNTSDRMKEEEVEMTLL